MLLGFSPWCPALLLISELPGGQSMTARCARDASAGAGPLGKRSVAGVVLAGDWEDLR